MALAAGAVNAAIPTQGGSGNVATGPEGRPMQWFETTGAWRVQTTPGLLPAVLRLAEILSRVAAFRRSLMPG
jgi:hypothetical protein